MSYVFGIIWTVCVLMGVGAFLFSKTAMGEIIGALFLIMALLCMIGAELSDKLGAIKKLLETKN